MKPLRLATYLCTVAWLLLSQFAAQPVSAQELTVIELKNRRADELIPVLKPLLAPTTALSGIDYKLIVRGNDNDLRRIREALAVLDQAPQQLLLSVKSANSSDIEREQVQVSGQLGSNTQLTVQTGANHNDSSGSNISSLRISEGQSAHISNGHLVPFAATVITQPGVIQNNSHNNRVIVQQRQVGTGIEVRVRITADIVIIDIDAQHDQMAGNNVAVNHVISQISGKLGQWLPLSQIENSTQESQSNLTGRTLRTAEELRSLWIKVEVLSD
jgi:type II secretory pathway component GspD/PulD (secretin)